MTFFIFWKHGVIFLLFHSMLATEKNLLLKNFRVVRLNHGFYSLIYSVSSLMRRNLGFPQASLLPFPSEAEIKASHSSTHQIHKGI